MDNQELKTTIFAAGCFWGVEEAFRELPGVIETEVGYTGGHTENPSYEDVCYKKTGHAEALRISFDPQKVTFKELLKKFWTIHDPTTLNRQGPDIGDQYRSAIFYFDNDQRKEAEESKENLELSGKYQGEIVTEIAPTSVFYPAEEYHQKYFLKRGGGVCHI